MASRLSRRKASLAPKHAWKDKRRRSNMRNAIVTVPRGKLAFPQEMRTTLRYVATHDLDPSSSTSNGVTFLANGIFKPEHTHTGHQPRGFDQYADLYNTFTVTASKISVTFAFGGYMGSGGHDATGKPSLAIYAKNTNDVPAPPSAICLVHKSAELNSTGTIESFQEKDKTKWVTITSAGEAKIVSTRLRTSEFFGKDALVGAEGYTGSSTADPSEKLYYHIMAGLNSGEYPGQVDVRANICVSYDVVWTNPKQLAAS